MLRRGGENLRTYLRTWYCEGLESVWWGLFWAEERGVNTSIVGVAQAVVGVVCAMLEVGYVDRD